MRKTQTDSLFSEEKDGRDIWKGERKRERHIIVDLIPILVIINWRIKGCAILKNNAIFDMQYLFYICIKLKLIDYRPLHKR